MAKRCTFQNIRELAFHQNHATVSIYLPAPDPGTGGHENEIRLKNHLADLSKRLTEIELPRVSVDQVFEPVRHLLEASSFWRAEHDAVAVIVDESYFRVYVVQRQTEELAVIGTVPHLTPLVAAVQDDEEFYILSVSKNAFSFARASRDRLQPIDFPDAPTGVADLHAPPDDRLRDLQQHSGGGVVGISRVARGEAAPIVHGHGARSGREEAHLLRYFLWIDRHVSRYLRGSNRPLVFAGDESLFPAYREISMYRHLLDDYVPGNAEARSTDVLLSEARRCVESARAGRRRDTIDAVAEAIGHGAGTANVLETVSAAREGRIDTLLLVDGSHAWGSLGPGGAARLNGHGDPRTEDLVNLSAVHTIRTAGEVVVVPGTAMPDGVVVQASYRY